MEATTTNSLLTLAAFIPVVVLFAMGTGAGAMRMYFGITTLVWGIGVFCAATVVFAANTNVLFALLPAIGASAAVMAWANRRPQRGPGE